MFTLLGRWEDLFSLDYTEAGLIWQGSCYGFLPVKIPETIKMKALLNVLKARL
jgi:hypothetical protein